ncbi:MAG: hypothetical protein AAFY15_13785, partial [Cyanobacteria bacterium J06648_11]
MQRQLLSQDHVSAFVVGGLKEYGSSEAICEIGCSLLLQLCRIGIPRSAAWRRQLEQDVIVSVLLKAEEEHSRHAGIVAGGLEGLERLAEFLKESWQAYAVTVIQQASEALDTHLDSAAICGHAIALLGHMAGVPETASFYLSSAVPGRSVAAALRHWVNERVRAKSIWLWAQLVALSSAQAQALFDAKVCELLGLSLRDNAAPRTIIMDSLRLLEGLAKGDDSEADRRRTYFSTCGVVADVMNILDQSFDRQVRTLVERVVHLLDRPNAFLNESGGEMDQVMTPHYNAPSLADVYGRADSNGPHVNGVDQEA